ncbi:alpha/beta hydrolase [Novosphingobium sp. BL-52-GroH]|uniref:alpha/beta hydrolase n=1 Tax=Novosphingobium sp. BL-52-GroH TaxID=3349877 RepID=UPI00384F1CEA
MAGAYDPDVEAYLALVREAGRPAFETLSVDAARAFYRSGRDTVNLPAIDVGSVEDVCIEGRGGPIPLRLYEPPAGRREPGPAILFFHGGGWVIGDLDTHDGICRHLVALTGWPLVAVDYRLAPEHAFPAAVEDALDAHGWVVENAGRLNVRADALVLAGDSAGGCLALVAALAAPGLGRPPAAGQVLFYPVTDLRGNTGSYREVVDVPITASTMAWFAGHYLSDAAQADDWRASPLLADGLGALSPTFLAVAGHDPLRDEGLALAGRIRFEGGEVTLRHLPGQVHGYLTVGRVVSEAGRTLAAAADFLKDLAG